MAKGRNDIPNIKPDTELDVKGTREGLRGSFNRTNLDLENRAPLGGPINTDPVTINGVEYGGFSAKYSPTEPYIQDGNQKSALVTVDAGGDVTDEGILKVTALDITSDEAGTKQGGTGGPNRVAPNQFNTVGGEGTYTNYKASTSPTTPLPSAGEPLKTRDDKDSKSKLNAYTPDSTYMESIIKYKSENEDKI